MTSECFKCKEYFYDAMFIFDQDKIQKNNVKFQVHSTSLNNKKAFPKKNFKNNHFLFKFQVRLLHRDVKPHSQ